MNEDALNTVSFSLPGHLIRRMHQISTQVFAQNMRAAGLDLTPVQFAALDALRHKPGIDQAGLAQAIDKDKATIGAVVDRLEQKGLVTRTINRRDKRARAVSLTAKGDKLLITALPVVRRLQLDILPGLTTDEYRHFITLATKVARAAGTTGPG
ncbi:MAG: MarR family winged helix-turn-helix transcriptional regulator [Qingshengfaniella sp.]